MTGSNREIQARQEAQDWFFKLQSAPDDEALSEEFFAWLDAGSQNEAAWGEVERSHVYLQERLADELPADPAKSDEALITASIAPEGHSNHVGQYSHPKTRRGATLGYISLAFAAAVAAIVYGPALYLQAIADHVTGRGETRQIKLADGSLVHLGAESAIKFKSKGSERSINLLRGVAFFDVQKDATRPFRVLANNVTTTVIGTRFEVRETATGASVAVADGAVQVKNTLGKDGEASKDVLLRPGEQIRVDAGARSALEFQLDPETVASWRSGKLIVKQWTVGETLQALARQYPGRVVIAPGISNGDLVNGVFDLTQPLKSIRLVAKGRGLRVRELSTLLVVVSAI